MIQFEDKKADIYQILSFCLGHLKRKIITLLKISLSQKNLDERPQLIIQLANQQKICKQYIQYIKNSQQKLIKKQDESLFQRFIYRVKQLVRNYLPHASLSHQIFVYLKKIQTYSFKSNYVLQDYIIHILQENPHHIQKKIQQQNIEIQKNNHKSKSSGFHQFHQQKNSYEIPIKLRSIRQTKSNFMFFNTSKYQKQLDIQEKREIDLKQQIGNRPVDIFNKSVKSLVDGLDCDVTVLRSMYFNLQRQKQSLQIKKNIQSPFSNSNKLVKQIQQQMLYQNRFIRQSIKSFDRQYAKLQLKLQKDPDYLIKNKKRCQTAGHPRRQFNFSILSEDQQQKPTSKKIFRKNDLHKKFETISHYPSQQQKLQLYKQIQNRKHNILKMKNISISANKGHLQLCAQSKQVKQKQKKASLMYTRTTGFNSLRKVAHINNNSKNVSQNLKKKYDIFLSSNCCAITNENFRISRQKQKQRQNSTIQLQDNEDMNKFQISTPMLKNSQHIYMKSNHETVDTLNLKQSNNYTTRLNQINKKNHQTIMTNDFDVLVKNFMKGANVNHRNYTTLQHRQKKVYETINPQLTVKTIKKK